MAVLSTTRFRLCSLSTIVLLFVVFPVQGCQGSEQKGEGEGNSRPSSDTNGDTRASLSQSAKELFALYGELRTIAGKGAIREKGQNGWQERFEGGAAIDAELSRPHMAMADDEGNVFIADKDAHAIRKVTPEGLIFTVAGTSEAGNGGDSGPGTELPLSSPSGLWVLGDGTVYILDLGNDKVRRLDPLGQMVTLFSAADGFGLGRGLWVDREEEVAYVACSDHVKKWTPSGGVETFADGFSGLGNLTVDPDGHLVVTDRVGHRVFGIDSGGEATPMAGNGDAEGGGSGFPALESALNEVRGVWFLSDGSYFLATHQGSQVWYVDTDGIMNLFLDGRPDHSHTGDGEAFDTPGHKISEARAVTVDPKGNVIVTENDFGYVRLVEKVVP